VPERIPNTNLRSAWMDSEKENLENKKYDGQNSQSCSNKFTELISFLRNLGDEILFKGGGSVTDSKFQGKKILRSVLSHVLLDSCIGVILFSIFPLILDLHFICKVNCSLLYFIKTLALNYISFESIPEHLQQIPFQFPFNHL
jgi:hypothetical protein